MLSFVAYWIYGSENPPQQGQPQPQPQNQDPLVEQLFDLNLLQIFRITRTDQMILTTDEEERIKSVYLSLKASNEISRFFLILRFTGDFCTIEKTMDFILKVEMEYNGVTHDKLVAKVIMDSIQDDLELRKWTMSRLKEEKDFTYKVKKQYALLLEKMKPFRNMLKKSDLAVLGIWNIATIVSVHFDFIKDIVIFYGMQHFCVTVLVSLCLCYFTYSHATYIPTLFPA